jgi:Squalene-hopene cyclase C-terminal domain
MSTANPSNPDPAAKPAAAKPAMAKPAAPAKPVKEKIEVQTDDEHHDKGLSANFIIYNIIPSTMTSFVVHMVAIIVLAFVTFAPPAEKRTLEIEANAADVEVLEEFKEEVIPEMRLDENAPVNESPLEYVAATQNMVADPVVITDNIVDPSPDAAVAEVQLVEIGIDTAPKSVMTKEIGATTGSGLSGRGAAAAGKFNVAKEGGTTASEKAVAQALKWISEHQNRDGSWNFNHQTGGNCNRQCSEPGGLDDCTTGATGMALLPLLGAGQTHKEGKYKQTVERGLYYLVNRMKVNNNMGNLAEGGGNMYSHGICAIVLTEAYAMTRDKSLMAPAQLSLNYIMYAQDPVGGGWRYSAKQPGDTSAVGWQLMALKSGHMAYLNVNPNTIKGAMRFLDSVQSDGGAKYGYTDPGAGPATSAVGLISRMYLGWKKDNAALTRGVEALGKSGPSPNAMYFNYYATQVMRQYGGEPWEKWNEKMRDMMVASQDQKGHQLGSWHMRGDHGAERGGRLYCTSLATMILEVYYRHMPIYKAQAAEEDFPL